MIEIKTPLAAAARGSTHGVKANDDTSAETGVALERSTTSDPGGIAGRTPD